MVLQHLVHPRPFADLRWLIRGRLWDLYKEQNPLFVQEPSPVDHAACPRCKSTNITQMKTGDKRWKCRFHSRGGRCGHEFQVPTTVQALTPGQRQARSEVWRQASSAAYEKFNAEYDDYIGTQAVLFSIVEHEWYLGMENTVTFCKKCAFLWDMKRMQLCSKCGQAYHLIGAALCAACDTENYKICEECGVYYHSVVYKFCLHCHAKSA